MQNNLTATSTNTDPQNCILQRSTVFPNTFIVKSDRKPFYHIISWMEFERGFLFSLSLSFTAEWTHFSRDDTWRNRAVDRTRKIADDVSTTLTSRRQRHNTGVWSGSIPFGGMSKIVTRDREPIDWRKYARCNIAFFGRGRTSIQHRPCSTCWIKRHCGRIL